MVRFKVRTRVETHANVFYFADDTTKVPKISNHNRMIGNHRYTTEDIGDRALSGKSDCDTANAQTGDDCGHVIAPVVKNDNGSYNHNRDFGSPAPNV